MGRTNLFELLANSNDMRKDVSRLDTMFTEYYFISLKPKHSYYTLKDFVDEFCFKSWPERGRCIDVDDFLDTINYSHLEMSASANNLDSFLTLIEVIYNFWHLAVSFGNKYRDELQYHDTVNMLQEIMDNCLSEYNQKAFYFPEQQKCIIAEDMPQITAAAEATDPETAIEIVRYNHRQLAGDIARKKAILKTLADNLEGRKK